MNAPVRAGADERPHLLHDAAATTTASRPDATVVLTGRLAAVEAGIYADRHRLPAAVVDEIARLFAAGTTVVGIFARFDLRRRGRVDVRLEVWRRLTWPGG